jgi:hypothetical protein
MRSSNDKRRFERFAVNLRGNYILQDDHKTVECRIPEISSEGLRIQSPVKIPFKSSLLLSVEVPDHEPPLTVSVTIRWQKEIYGERDFSYMAGGQIEESDTKRFETLLEHMRTHPKP